MARTCVKIPYTCTFEAAQNVIIEILRKKGYKEIDYKKERVWRCGLGLMTAMKYIKVEFDTSSVNLYGWICTGIADISGSEMDLNGVVGAIPKKQTIKVLEEIKQALVAMR